MRLMRQDEQVGHLDSNSSQDQDGVNITIVMIQLMLEILENNNSKHANNNQFELLRINNKTKQWTKRIDSRK